MATFVLAKFLGLYLWTTGLAMIIAPQRFKGMFEGFSKKSDMLWVGAIIAILFGAFIVSVHNVWEWSWKVSITILGWWGLIKGFLLLVFPESFMRFWEPLLGMDELNFRIWGVVIFLLGLFFSYQGGFIG